MRLLCVVRAGVSACCADLDGFEHVEKDEVWLVLELCELGSLSTLMRRKVTRWDNPTGTSALTGSKSAH